jgi:hypothetical protein
MKKLMKRTESQDVSDDGHEKSNPYLMTGKFENKGFDVMSDDSK